MSWSTTSRRRFARAVVTRRSARRLPRGYVYWCVVRQRRPGLLPLMCSNSLSNLYGHSVAWKTMKPIPKHRPPVRLQTRTSASAAIRIRPVLIMTPRLTSSDVPTLDPHRPSTYSGRCARPEGSSIDGKTKAEQDRRDHYPRRGVAQEHPHGGVPVGDGEGRSEPHPGGVPAPQPRPRPATRVARQGRAGLVRPRGAGAAAVHPGEGPPEGADRRPAAAQQGRGTGGGRPTRPVRRLQRPAKRQRSHRRSTATTPTGPTA